MSGVDAFGLFVFGFIVGASVGWLACCLAILWEYRHIKGKTK